MTIKHTLIASALMILTMLAVNYLGHSEDIQPNKPFSSFPRQIGEWKGIEDRFDQQIDAILGVDDYFLGNFYSTRGEMISLYVGFYQSQRKGKQIHSPKNCMPGAGWNIMESTIVELDIPVDDSGKLNVIKLVLQKGDRKQIALYWFHSRGRIIASEYAQRFYLIVDSITRHRTDGSFVRLIAPVKDDEEASMQQLREFTKLLLPLLKEYIPS